MTQALHQMNQRECNMYICLYMLTSNLCALTKWKFMIYIQEKQ